MNDQSSVPGRSEPDSLGVGISIQQGLVAATPADPAARRKTALSLVDEKGLAALTMRALARSSTRSFADGSV